MHELAKERIIDTKKEGKAEKNKEMRGTDGKTRQRQEGSQKQRRGRRQRTRHRGRAERRPRKKHRLILIWKLGVTAICSHALPQDSTGAMVQVTGK